MPTKLYNIMMNHFNLHLRNTTPIGFYNQATHYYVEFQERIFSWVLKEIMNKTSDTDVKIKLLKLISCPNFTATKQIVALHFA